MVEIKIVGMDSFNQYLTIWIYVFVNIKMKKPAFIFNGIYYTFENYYYTL